MKSQNGVLFISVTKCVRVVLVGSFLLEENYQKQLKTVHPYLFQWDTICFTKIVLTN